LKIIGVLESNVKIFDTDRLVKFDVVPFIILLVIELELLIFCDVILFVCKLPLDIILPDIV
jgi:hypothetical protein